MGRGTLVDYAVVLALLVAGAAAILAFGVPGLIVGPVQLGFMLLWFKVVKSWNDP